MTGDSAENLKIQGLMNINIVSQRYTSDKLSDSKSDNPYKVSIRNKWVRVTDTVSDNHAVGSHVAEKSLAEKQPPVKVSDSQKQREDMRKGMRYISFHSSGI